MKLGKLEKVELRDVWKHEALDFTKWLAEEKNLNLLSEKIGIDIELIKTEALVGNFNVDIYAEELGTGRKVIIENQLEKTDHKYLGQIITYASGLDAEIIIWIVKEAREEHLKAVEWLNDHLDDKIHIFLIEMELWKIEDSPIAPNFKTIAQSNSWVKSLKNNFEPKEVREQQMLQYEFWARFKELGGREKLPVRNPRYQAWTELALGRGAKCFICLEAYKTNLSVSVNVYDEGLYDSFLENKEEIEKELGFFLEWDKRTDNIANRKLAGKIKVSKKYNFDKKETWDNELKWLVEKSKKLHDVFSL